MEPVVDIESLDNNKYPNYLKDYNVLFNDAPLGLDNYWINFQKKYEFNPPHSHSGVFSFVIWLKIPYDLQEELDYFGDVNQGSKTSMFNFLYTDGLGKIKTYNVHVDKNFEGKICMFPSNMLHYVNPFYTSDDYRISLSGNIKHRTVYSRRYVFTWLERIHLTKMMADRDVGTWLSEFD